jgi:menaquinone-dependent protoporphyrinogen oxidase
MNVLILYSSTEGHTRKIAGHMEEHFRSQGHVVMSGDVSGEPPSPDLFDVVLIGGSLHVMKHQVMLRRYILEHAGILNRKVSAFFSVSLGIATGEEEAKREARRTAEAFLHSAGWIPRRIELVAGALKCDHQDFFKLMVMKKLGGASDTMGTLVLDQEYTDWGRLKAFCNEIASAGVSTTKVPAIRHDPSRFSKVRSRAPWPLEKHHKEIRSSKAHH